MPGLIRTVANARRVGPMLLLLTLAACGGGGGGGNDSSSSFGTYTPGVFQPSSSFANRCATPRSGTDPFTGQRYPDLQGARVDENNWLRSWSHEYYLWYSELPDLDPSLYQTDDYFDRLKTSATTASGQPKDKFHFTYPTDVWEGLSQSGAEVGYGLQFALVATTPPRKAMIAYVEPSPPSATTMANVARGAEILTVDGADLVNVSTQQGVDTLNAGLFPENAGESHTFTIRDVGSAGTRTITLISANVTSTPVQNVRTVTAPTGETVGYFTFNDHIATAEGGLIDAFNTLKAANISDLVVDIRYNGGGYLDIASEIAYMIAGAARTSGQTFERLQFSDKYPNTNPITGQALTPTPFYTTTRGLQAGLPSGQALPTLNLSRVFLLTGPNTCSASESIINGLRGVNVDVYLIGSTTCGKPYGFYPDDNCGTTYFSIEFRGINAAGFGDYSDGFVPANTTGAPATRATVPGCSVADDFTHALGDPDEERLATALAFRTSLQCPGPPTGTVKALAAATNATPEPIVPKSIWRTNRIVPRP